MSPLSLVILTCMLFSAANNFIHKYYIRPACYFLQLSIFINQAILVCRYMSFSYHALHKWFLSSCLGIMFSLGYCFPISLNWIVMQLVYFFSLVLLHPITCFLFLFFDFMFCDICWLLRFHGICVCSSMCLIYLFWSC